MKSHSFIGVFFTPEPADQPGRKRRLSKSVLLDQLAHIEAEIIHQNNIARLCKLKLAHRSCEAIYGVEETERRRREALCQVKRLQEEYYKIGLEFDKNEAEEGYYHGS